MKPIETLAYAMSGFAGLSQKDFDLSLPYWHVKEYKKGELYNNHQTICTHLGFIIQGVFRSYVIDKKKDQEKNIFFYSENQFVVTFKSFIKQTPCDYYTEAVADAKVICICLADLLFLYGKSHAWTTFGRLLAEEAFTVAIQRTESFIFKTPEERYLDLIKDHPAIIKTIPLYHISSYLGVQGPSLSRIRKKISGK